MDPFKVVYYPNSECAPIILARSILIFDEINFLDHASLTFAGAGTIGHDSMMRQVAEPLKKEGYALNVFKPEGGPVKGELEKMIDLDLGNHEFRKVFLQMLRVDPSFLIRMVPNGNYGHYGDADNLRKLILNVRPQDIPHRVSEISGIEYEHGIPPNFLIAMSMASDSYKLNLGSYLAIDREKHLFGDNRGMAQLLAAKIAHGDQPRVSGTESISHTVAFKLLESLIPNEAFRGKDFVDIVRFKNEMSEENKKFKERILEMTIDLQGLEHSKQQAEIDKLIYKDLLPEAREYQNKLADAWDTFFKESAKAVISDASQFAQIVVTVLPLSLSAALLAAASSIGVKVFPHLIDYLKDKEKIERRNPYTYLMKFK